MQLAYNMIEDYERISDHPLTQLSPRDNIAIFKALGQDALLKADLSTLSVPSHVDTFTPECLVAGSL